MHLLPSKFGLQVHIPLDVHEVEDEPELLHPQARKVVLKKLYAVVYN